MSRPNLRVVGVLLALAAARLAFAAERVEWRTLDAGSLEARHTNKAILIDFWADWCVNCATMDADVFTDANVVAAMRRVVPVRVDIDRKKDLARRYSVEGVPALVLADAFGNELFRHTGALTTPVMLGLLRELPPDVAEINRLSAVLETDEKNFTALEALGRELRAARLFRASTDRFERALKSPGAKAAGPVRGDILLALGENRLDLREYADAARAFERYQRELRDGPRDADAMLGQARALLGQGQRGKAEAVLASLSKRDMPATMRDEVERLLGGGSK